MASPSNISEKQKEVSPKMDEEASAQEQESLEMLSLAEYWGVRTDIDAAQGGNGERKIIDAQYDWDNAASASKEEAAFSEVEKEKKISHNTQEH